MAQTVRHVFLVQMEKTLGKVKKIKLVSSSPQTVAQAPERPAAFISNGPDLKRDFRPFPNTDGSEDAKVRGFIRLYSNQEDGNLAKDQEELIQDVVNQIKSDFDVFTALTPKLYIEGVFVISDPIIDLQQDLSIVTLAVDYHN